MISQVYPPDPASVGQHMHDAAAEMARRGWAVRVLASARGYDDPSMKYPSRETLDGVSVRRLPLSSFGKGSIAVRLAGGFIFTVLAAVRGVFTRRVDAIVVSTSPPMAPIAAIAVSVVRRAPILFWVMDLNPDQMIALGKTTERSIPSRLFNLMNRAILRRAKRVVVLDRFMARRVNRKVDVSDKLDVAPPWPHEDHAEPVEHANNPFRREHALEGVFVVMYSGNHSPANPLDTILAAAERLADRDDIRFLFVGGGLEKQKIEDAVARGARNILSLPYQPIDSLRHSLSAADAHLVTLGDEVVGVVHPCKVYGAMAVARPILFVGPEPSHVSDLLADESIGVRVAHGDVDGAVRAVETLAAMPPDQRRAMGERARAVITGRLSKASLCGGFCDAIESMAGRTPSANAAIPEAPAP
ncbi:MAG: glycosyltransferase WbuB [Planctomycetota bacterium]|nr:MAG: glycosyltransferase WbuB [Planctomycetota bacterium]